LSPISVRGDSLLPDLRGEHRTKPVPPGTYRLVADINPTFMEHVLDLPQRQGEADIHHHSKADNFGRCLEISEWVFHPTTPGSAPRQDRQFSSDKAAECGGAIGALAEAPVRQLPIVMRTSP
jgi:hypothetical protein